MPRRELARRLEKTKVRPFTLGRRSIVAEHCEHPARDLREFGDRSAYNCLGDNGSTRLTQCAGGDLVSIGSDDPVRQRNIHLDHGTTDTTDLARRGSGVGQTSGLHGIASNF